MDFKTLCATDGEQSMGQRIWRIHEITDYGEKIYHCSLAVWRRVSIICEWTQCYYKREYSPNKGAEKEDFND